MTPTHPLGLTSHPEWPKVRERVTQNAIARQREHQAAIRDRFPAIRWALARVAYAAFVFGFGALLWVSL
jgi:hypothetical protein